MTAPYSLIVTDTSPLITLALPDSLEALLRPGLAVHIPDAVYTEAIRIRDAPGAGLIVEWHPVAPDKDSRQWPTGRQPHHSTRSAEIVVNRKPDRIRTLRRNAAYA